MFEELANPECMRGKPGSHQEINIHYLSLGGVKLFALICIQPQGGNSHTKVKSIDFKTNSLRIELIPLPLWTQLCAPALLLTHVTGNYNTTETISREIRDQESKADS